MSIQVRALDPNTGDWTFGQGGNNYRTNVNAVAQNIRTRLSLFRGECFFATNAGVDWLNLIGQKSQTAINLAVAATILNTANVTGLKSLASRLDPVTREYRITYAVQTAYSVTIEDEFVFDLNGTAVG